MAKIIGNTTATPNPRPDWLQTDETKADYIKNKPAINMDDGEFSIVQDAVADNENVATGKGSGAFGANSKAEADYAFALGSWAAAREQAAFAANAGDAMQVFSAAFNTGYAEGDRSFAKGQKTHAIGYASETGGIETVAEGIASEAGGKETKAIGAFSHSQNLKTIARGDNSHAGGEATEAKYLGSFVHGLHLTTGRDYQAMVGQYGVEDPNALFVVATGSGQNDRVNQFVVTDAGANLSGNLTAKNINLNGDLTATNATLSGDLAADNANFDGKVALRGIIPFDPTFVIPVDGTLDAKNILVSNGMRAHNVTTYDDFNLSDAITFSKDNDWITVNDGSSFKKMAWLDAGATVSNGLTVKSNSQFDGRAYFSSGFGAAGDIDMVNGPWLTKGAVWSTRGADGTNNAGAVRTNTLYLRNSTNQDQSLTYDDVKELKENAIKIDNKVDKVDGKDLSTNDFTDDYKNKVDAAMPSTESIVKYTVQNLSDEQRAQARANIGAGSSDFSGDYNELINKPTIPDTLSDLASDVAHRTVSDTEKETWNAKSDFSGSYNDLTNKPVIPSIAGLATETYVDNKVASIVDSSPEALNTLNELAAALGDDPNFATTVSTEIGKKVDKTTTVNGHALSGNVTLTKSDIDLGNVPNVATNDQTPTFTEATTLANIATGEKVSTLFGKIKKAITDFIAHLANNSNPHGVTKSQVGLDNVENKSSATIRSELTKANVTDALGYTPPTTDTKYTHPTSHPASMITGLATVATSGSYNDLTNKPNIPDEYVLPAAGSSLGGVQTGGDVTISSGVITVNDDSHNHTIANVDGLQDALDGRAPSTHNHDDAYDTTGAAASALTSAKTYTDTVAAQKSQVQIITWEDDD